MHEKFFSFDSTFYLKRQQKLNYYELIYQTFLEIDLKIIFIMYINIFFLIKVPCLCVVIYYWMLYYYTPSKFNIYIFWLGNNDELDL